MCVSAAPAHFSKTIVYGGEVTSMDRPIHVIGYQNTFRSERSGFFPWGRGVPNNRGNAMLLHFPAKPDTMTQENILDTSGCKNLLKNMEQAVQDNIRSKRFSLGGASRGVPHVIMFVHGIYTIVLAQEGKHIIEVLDQIPEDVRPPLNEDVFSWYSKWFPQWPVALCCFNNAEAAKSDPMFWWYEPQDPETLFVPTLDAHDGYVPRLGHRARLDHTVIFGSDRFENGVGLQVRYTDTPKEELMRYLPTRVVGTQLENLEMPNGDFTSSVEQVRRGSPEFKRTQPHNF